MTVLTWTEPDTDTTRTVPWRALGGGRPPRRVLVADDRTRAREAYRHACEGTALVWRGDYHGARQLLGALGRRVERALPPVDGFHQHRRNRAHRARVLGMLLVVLGADHGLDLRRAPDVRRACTEAYGPAPGTPGVVPLRELLGVLGAHEWRRTGVPVAALDGDRIHPHYGVFAPVRGEYVDLVRAAELPRGAVGGVAFDLGTGTGVLAAVLARRGVGRVVATDAAPRALACARDNVDRLGLPDRIEVSEAGPWPSHGRANLVVCNPPWLPARPTSPLDEGVYDPDSRMLRGFLTGLAGRLAPGGEGWLILSDLAELLGLRGRDELTNACAAAGLRVAGRVNTRPRHPRSRDRTDPLHAARAAETTSLWRLVPTGEATMRA
ncbi:methyltransferase [Streptomyces sp. NPDC051684]|uniref:methyltransferase n=1 Tax=Streptomyces sp. NPDC051684 TaxID=3365670 RepID=UPI0037A7D9DF